MLAMVASLVLMIGATRLFLVDVTESQSFVLKLIEIALQVAAPLATVGVTGYLARKTVLATAETKRATAETKQSAAETKQLVVETKELHGVVNSRLSELKESWISEAWAKGREEAMAEATMQIKDAVAQALAAERLAMAEMRAGIAEGMAAQATPAPVTETPISRPEKKSPKAKK